MNESAFILDIKQHFFFDQTEHKTNRNEIKSIRYIKNTKINKITYIFFLIGHCDDFRCDHDIFFCLVLMTVFKIGDEIHLRKKKVYNEQKMEISFNTYI